MIIDTDQATSWVKKHLAICVPVATSLLSWYAATRWQAAIDHNQLALMMFYFCVSASSGIASTVLVVRHFINMGFFDDK